MKEVDSTGQHTQSEKPRLTLRETRPFSAGQWAFLMLMGSGAVIWQFLASNEMFPYTTYFWGYVGVESLFAILAFAMPFSFNQQFAKNALKRIFSRPPPLSFLVIFILPFYFTLLCAIQIGGLEHIVPLRNLLHDANARGQFSYTAITWTFTWGMFWLHELAKLWVCILMLSIPIDRERVKTLLIYFASFGIFAVIGQLGATSSYGNYSHPMKFDPSVIPIYVVSVTIGLVCNAYFDLKLEEWFRPSLMPLFVSTIFSLVVGGFTYFPSGIYFIGAWLLCAGTVLVFSPNAKSKTKSSGALQ